MKKKLIAVAVGIWTATENAVLLAADANAEAEISLTDAITKNLGSAKAGTKEANDAMKVFGEKIRKFDGVILTEKQLRSSGDSIKVLAATRYNTVSTAYRRMKPKKERSAATKDAVNLLPINPENAKPVFAAAVEKIRAIKPEERRVGMDKLLAAYEVCMKICDEMIGAIKK